MKYFIIIKEVKMLKDLIINKYNLLKKKDGEKIKFDFKEEFEIKIIGEYKNGSFQRA